MAFQPVVDTVEINVIYSQHGEILQNVFYAKLPGGYLLADLAALAAAIDAQVAATWLAQQVIEAFYLRTEVRGLAVVNDLLVIDGTSSGGGALTGGALPNNVTLSIKKESGLTGRSARGRSYWIGPAKTKLNSADENFYLSADVDAIVLAVDNIRTKINGVGLWEAVLVSRFTGGAPRVAGLTFPWIASSSVDNRIDTQRGRLP